MAGTSEQWQQSTSTDSLTDVRQSQDRAVEDHPVGGYELLAQGTASLEVRGSLAEARTLFFHAAVEGAGSGDQELVGQAVLGWSGLWVHENRGVVDAERIQAWRVRALRGLPPNSRTSRRLAVRAAAEADYVDGLSARIEGAIESARASADVLVLGEALSLGHHCMLGPQHAERRAAIANELVILGATEGRRIDLLMGLAWRTVDMVLAGDPHADRALSELRRSASDPAHLATLYLVEAVEVMMLTRSGRFDEAEVAAGRCLELGQQVGDADALGWYGAQMCAVRWYQGRSAELVPLVTDLVSSQTLTVTNDAYLAALAVSTAAAGASDDAVVALRRLRRSGLAGLRASSTWMVALFGAAVAAHAVQDHEVAAEVRDLLTPYADLPVMASLGIACFGSAHYPLALAALTMGDAAEGRRRLEAAIRHNHALGNLPAARLASELLHSAHSTSLAATPVVTCTRSGQSWRISLGPREVVVPDCIGLRYLAVLTKNPGVDVHASELTGRPAELSPSEPVLDDHAVAEYRRRLHQLEEEMENAGDDEVRLDRAQREYEALVDELARAHGLGGRSRDLASTRERSRTSVQKALRRAIALIDARDPVLAKTIDAHLVTGFVCRYR